MKETIKIRAVDKEVSITIDAKLEDTSIADKEMEETGLGCSYTKRMLIRELVHALTRLIGIGANFGAENITIEK